MSSGEFHLVRCLSGLTVFFLISILFACAHQSLELVSFFVISVVRRYNARNSGRGMCDRAWSLVVSKLIRNEEICDRKLLLFQMSVGT